MQLTQKQESFISRYLRDLALQFDESLTDNARERGLRQIQAWVYKELEGLPGSSISDEDVLAALRRASSMARPAESSRPGTPAPATASKKAPPASEAEVKPVWLGVCAYNADRFGVSPWAVRLATVGLGLVTGPVAFFCYLIAYGEFYMASDEKERPTINFGQLALRAIVPLAAAFALRWAAYKLLDLIAYGYVKAFSEPFPPLGKWDWLTFYDGTIFFLICASIIPISILSGLPLANAWGHSLKRLAQALVALYFMALCFGIASMLVGLILDRVQPYMQ